MFPFFCLEVIQSINLLFLSPEQNKVCFSIHAHVYPGVYLCLTVSTLGFGLEVFSRYSLGETINSSNMSHISFHTKTHAVYVLLLIYYS